MMISSLWAGIESILGVEHELRFRISSYLAAYLQEKGKERLELNRNFKKLYDFRSKAVHGSHIDDMEMHKHIIEVRNLLSKLLIKIVESKTIPNQNDFDGALFT